MLRLERARWVEMMAEAECRLPLEACGLLVGRPGVGPDDDVVVRFVPIPNEAASPVAYRLEATAYLAAASAADDDGLDIVGVMHSHPTTEAYPSQTDVVDATNPMIPDRWHWVLVGLAGDQPQLRSFHIVDGEVTEETVLMSDR